MTEREIIMLAKNMRQVQKEYFANPRTITDRKLELLVERLLAFPKMIELRPVVVDNKMTALGGNMRVKAYRKISGMSIDEIKKILEGTKNYKRLTAAEKTVREMEYEEYFKSMED